MPTNRTYTNEIEPIQLPPKQPTRKPYVSATTNREVRRLHHQARQRQAVELITTIAPPARTDNTALPSTPVFTPHAGAEEKTTAMDRAKATVFRTHPLTIVLAILATGLSIQFQLGMGPTLCIFAATAITGYWLFHRTDYQYSRAGLERHRINQATALSQAQMQHDKDLRKIALDGIIRQLETRSDDY